MVAVLEPATPLLAPSRSQDSRPDRLRHHRKKPAIVPSKYLRRRQREPVEATLQGVPCSGQQQIVC